MEFTAINRINSILTRYGIYIRDGRFWALRIFTPALFRGLHKNGLTPSRWDGLVAHGRRVKKLLGGACINI